MTAHRRKHWFPAGGSLLLALLLALSCGERYAGAAAPKEPRQAAPSQRFAESLTLADAGLRKSLVLRGFTSSRSVSFTVPQTELVRSATLRLLFHASPGLLPTESQLNLSLNGTLFATLPVARETSGRGVNSTLLEQVIVVPPELVVHSNELGFELIGRTASGDAASAWVQIDAVTGLDLEGERLTFPDDLRILPLPFFDAGMKRPTVPIVFLAPPSPKELQAAGVVASWFGILADDHPAHFPVSLGQLPPGNVILISQHAADLPPELKLPAGEGPEIVFRPNPADPAAKVLVLAADDADGVLTAAIGLTRGAGEFAGDAERVTVRALPQRRQPDGAPRWLRTDQPLPLSTLPHSIEARGDGTVLLRASFRTPPDLNWMGETAFPLRLGLSKMATEGPPRTLQVRLNGRFIAAVSLAPGARSPAAGDAVLPVSVAALRPFRNTLEFQLSPSGEDHTCCGALPEDTLLEPLVNTASLDFRDASHWTTLPNLQLFANAGYPFTRSADLAGTTVVLPGTPTAQEIELFLDLMAHCGAQTGYPVLRVEVADARALASGKDLLVLGTIADSPAFAALQSRLPVAFARHGVRLSTPARTRNSVLRWLRGRGEREEDSAFALDIEGSAPDAVMEGIEWPARSGHTAVLIALRDESQSPGFSEAFRRASPSGEIAGAVSILRGASFASYSRGTDEYHVGSLPLWQRLQVSVAGLPWWPGILLLLLVFFLAARLRRPRLSMEGRWEEVSAP